MPETRFENVDLVAVAVQHDRLRALASTTPPDNVQAVLNLAAAVLLHGAIEPAHLQRILRFVDPAVLRDLAIQHERFERDVEFLIELQRAEPSSPDIQTLAEAILRRAQQHLDRDDRVLYGPMKRFLESDPQ